MSEEMFGRNFRMLYMRRVSRLHILLLLLLGFLVGYWLVPHFVSRTELFLMRDPAIHYTPSGRDFVVEGKEKKILSGAIHYFRVVPAYWEDRLSKLKAAGLNTVETYMPWNLHEPAPGEFDFTGILDIQQFLDIAKSLGLHAIVRPGPYICSEWELGGLPAWLLHDPKMVLRSTYPGYLEAVGRYFAKVFEVLTPLQSSFGGPVIAFQIENELADYPQDTAESKEYLLSLYKLMRGHGVRELLFTSDGQNSMQKSLELRPAEEVLLTVNFMTDQGGLADLKRLQPDKPVMVMEFWTGWFDHWNEAHLTRNQDPVDLSYKTAAILKQGGSVNFYMFHGGTNFGFMNGANWGFAGTRYLPTITSYDYDAPISESGALNAKFIEIRKVLTEEAGESLPQYPLPPIPANPPTASYADVKLTLYIPILNTLQYLPEPYVSDKTVPMELLPLHGCGQGYGFVLYRAMVPSSAASVSIHQLRDYGMAMVDFKMVHRLSFFESQTITIPKSNGDQGSGEMVLDILVENAGRVNYDSLLESRKGILGGVEVDGKKLEKWKTYSFEFKPSFIEDIDSGGMWLRTPAPPDGTPSLFKGTFTIPDAPKDTFIDMEGWEKGQVFINGVNLGRYWTVGPQRTLYVPAPVLKRGVNKVMIFELYSQKTLPTVSFRDKPILNSYRYS